MKKINVRLLGGKSIFGGREKPLQAQIISCDMFDNCSLYEDGMCALIEGHCKYGKSEYKKGYTSRAMKYYDFKHKYEEDEQYGKLRTFKKGIFVVGDYVGIKSSYLKISKDEIPKYVFNTFYGFSTGESYVSKEDFDADFLHRVCEYRPRTLFDNRIIDAYEEKEVQVILADAKQHLPEIYREFIEKYPEYNKEIDYTGREAVLVTCKSGIEIEIKSGEFWRWDGELLHLVRGNLSPFWLNITGEIQDITVKPKDTFPVKVVDNDWVLPDTVFV